MSFFTPAGAASSSTISVPVVFSSLHSTGFCMDSGTLIIAARWKI